MRNNNIVGVKAKQLAIKTVELYKNLSYQQHEYVMSKQILKSGTSVGANLSEAEYSQSDADYLSKRSIALKEAAETHFWLEVLLETKYISQQEYEPLEVLTGEIIRMLVVGNQTIRDSITSNKK